MPAPERVRSMLAELLGRSIELERVSAPDPDAPFVVADFQTDAGATAALLVADLPGCAALAAGLTMMPAAMVESVRLRNAIDEPSIVENFGEIANVLAQLFNSSDTPHLRWRTAVQSGDAIPAPTAALLESPAARRDLGVTVEGYGSGKIAILVA